MKKLLSIFAAVLALASFDAFGQAKTNLSAVTVTSSMFDTQRVVIVIPGSGTFQMPFGVLRTNFAVGTSNGLFTAMTAADLSTSNLVWNAARTNNTPLDFQHNSGVSGDHMVIGGRAGKTITNLYVQARNFFEIQAPVTRMTGSLSVAGSSLVGAGAKKALIVHTNGDVVATNAGVLEWSYFTTNDPGILYLGRSDAGVPIGNVMIWPTNAVFISTPATIVATTSNLTQLRVDGNIRLAHDSGKTVFLDSSGLSVPAFTSTLLPAADLAYSIGANGQRWAVGYFNDIDLAGIITMPVGTYIQGDAGIFNFDLGDPNSVARRSDVTLKLNHTDGVATRLRALNATGETNSPFVVLNTNSTAALFEVTSNGVAQASDVRAGTSSSYVQLTVSGFPIVQGSGQNLYLQGGNWLINTSGPTNVFRGGSNTWLGWSPTTVPGSQAHDTSIGRASNSWLAVISSNGAPGSGSILSSNGTFRGELKLGTAASQPCFRAGSGSPESIVTAPPGSLYIRTDGGAGTTLYVKESGTGSTGWVGK
jgi:hypothetical protein